MFNQRSIIILFLNRNSFQFYGGNLSGIVSIEIPQTVLLDLDVLRKDDLYTIIKQCVKQYALMGTQLIVVLSDLAYFEKTFALSDKDLMDTDILKFFDAVPYDSIWTKVYSMEKGKRAVGVNKALCETLQQGFSLQGVSIKAFIPSFALGQLSTKHTLDKELAAYIMRNFDNLVKQSLFDPLELGIAPSQEKAEEGSPATRKKSSLPLLLGIFGALIAILAIVVIMQFR
jgi:hypothetical protein